MERKNNKEDCMRWIDPNLTSEQIQRMEESEEKYQLVLRRYHEKHPSTPADSYARDLTDDELDLLHEEYLKGMEFLKSHPWNMEPEIPYWKTKPKKFGN